MFEWVGTLILYLVGGFLLLGLIGSIVGSVVRSIRNSSPPTPPRKVTLDDYKDWNTD